MNRTLLFICGQFMYTQVCKLNSPAGTISSRFSQNILVLLSTKCMAYP